MAVILNQAKFQTSAAALSQMPPDQGVEVAFIGRSNSGKSSAINAITGVKKLARTSKTPGRTQLMNCFDLGSDRRLIDLPGYGFAKVPQKVRSRWHSFINDYLAERDCLQGLVVLMDVRHPLKDSDQDMLAWASRYEIPVLALLTKADKLKRGALLAVEAKVRQQIASDLVSVQVFSAVSGVGLEGSRAVLTQWLA